MRCACTLACSSEWMAAGQRGGREKYSCAVKRAMCAHICLKIVCRANAGKMRRKV